MTVAVVYAISLTGRLALDQAVEEAQRRNEDLAVLHVLGSPDAQTSEAYRRSISEEIDKVLAATDTIVGWKLHLRNAASDTDVNDVLLGLVDEVDASVVVVGARRRSPIGKALLGSTAQSVVLGARSPVLVIKPS
jgi:nucleotide-binding universal stress UspA family protein